MKTKVLILITGFLLFACADLMDPFTDNGDGTVTDNNTGLMWQESPAVDWGDEKTWEEAIIHCEDLSLGGYTDWRLPNIRELVSITDDFYYDPAIDTTSFPFETGGQTYFWSSTTSASDSSSAWFVYFSDGAVAIYDKSSNHYVRCVRGGQ